jgi:soluble lytic murein transglycosylase-like protein
MGGKPTAMKKIIVVLFALVVVVAAFYREESRAMLMINPINSPEVIKVEEMIDKTGAKVPPATKKKVALAIAEHARYYGIKPKNLVAIAYVESNFKPTLINSTGDHGLMQINWPTWKNRFTRDPKDLLNVYKNVEVACKIININKSMGQTDLADYHSFNDEPKAIYQAKLREVLRRL